MNKKDQQLLLKLARDTLVSYFKDTDPDTVQCSHLTQLMGCFVTLNKSKELRGCIGFSKPIMPLYEQIIAATKAAADNLVMSYHRTYGINCITTRCTNNFGPNQFPEKLIPKTIIRLLKNLKVPLYGDGTQIRSWIYVNDHVQAIESLISKGKLGHVYNITAYEEITNKSIVEKILDILGKSHDIIEYVNDRPGHDKRYSIDCSKIENQTGWKPRYNFDDALKQTVNWYLQNQSWWEPLIDENTLHPQPWTISWK
ncbi:MAG: AMMECR1 domain-containing protein [Thaumarchaeota archaeon]|nr:AMMECR1 domain-containing protein [Nitrososphaerota archaeon]